MSSICQSNYQDFRISVVGTLFVMTMAIALLFLIWILSTPEVDGEMSPSELKKYCKCRELVPPDTGRFYIRNVRTQLVLDIKGKSSEQDADIILAPKSDDTSQLWMYLDGALLNSYSGLALAVASVAKPAKNFVVMKKWDTGNDKKWLFDCKGYIRSMHWDQVLTQQNDYHVFTTKKSACCDQQFERVALGC